MRKKVLGTNVGNIDFEKINKNWKQIKNIYKDTSTI